MKVHLFAVVLLCIISDGFSRIADYKPFWSKSWDCIDDSCIAKIDPPGTGVGNVTQTSSEACRLVCGPFGPLWPRPTNPVTLVKRVITFLPEDIRFTISEPSDEVKNYIETATGIFKANIIKEAKTNCTLSSDMEVRIKIDVYSEDMTLDWTTDEGYTLDISNEGSRVDVKIGADTVFGARHGLETLSQLITPYTVGSPQSGGRRCGYLMVAGASIKDKPVYPHRGLMLDTARHYIPVAAIRRTLDGMASTKLNVLHWHATDSQSFPLVSTRVPQLARYGAYSQDEVYTPSDVRDLLHYARVRGIRVVLEIDAPAHAGAGWQWGESAGLGNLTTCWQHSPWREECIQPPCGQLNPANPHLYRVLGELYKDIAEMFPPGEVFHMGGDEVFFACWNHTKQITDLLDSRGMGRETADFVRLWAEYQATALRIYDEAAGGTVSPRTPPGQKRAQSPIILWSSHLTSPSIIQNYLQKERYVIQTWVVKEDPLPMVLLEQGYRVIFSTKDKWYLDHGFWGITDYHSWREAYENQLPKFKAVLGGEACMWTEYVDENNLDTRIWPRAAAVGERLWADPNHGARYAEGRLARHRQRLVARGLNPEALHPQWCYEHEGLCA